MNRGAIGLGLVCVIVGHASGALAQEASWLERGREALLDRDATRARWAFGQGLDEADDTETRWRLLLGFALANEMEGSTLEAVYAYRRFLAAVRSKPAMAERPPWPIRRERALSDVRRLEQKLLTSYAKLTVESTPRGATVVVDGETTQLRTPAVVYVAAGRHQVRLELEKYQPAKLLLEVEPGDLPLLQPELKPLPVPPPPPVVVVTEVDLSPWMRFSGALSLALGGSLVIAGGALHASALRMVDDLEALPPVPTSLPRDDALRTRVSDYQTGYITSYAVGGAFLATGVGLLVADALTGDRPTSAFIAPRPDGVAIGVAGHW